MIKIKLAAPHAACGMIAAVSAAFATSHATRLINRSEANMMQLVRMKWSAGETAMLERALPIPQPEIRLGQDSATHRPVSSHAVLDGIAAKFAHMLRVVGEYFAAGGPLS